MGTISDKSAYLNTTKIEIRQKINDLGQDLDEEDTFRSYVEALEEVWNEYPKVIATDVTEATLEGTKAGKMKLDIKGNSTQDTTEGKNKFDVNVIQERTTGGITMTFNGQTIHLQGTTSANANFYMKTGKSIVLPAGTYFLTRSSMTGIATLKLTSGSDTIVATGSSDVSFTLASETTIDGLTLQVPSTVGNVNKDIVIQLEAGSTGSSYEPYTGRTSIA